MMFCVDSKDCAKVQKIPLMAKHIFIFFASPGVYLSALSARFSAARDEGRQKQPSGAEKSQFFDRISRREQINCNFLMELAVRSKKIAIFYRKSEKTALPTPWKVKNTQFLCFQPLGKAKMPRKPPVVGRRNAKNDEKYPSSADEMQKTIKIVCRRATKHKIQQKLLIVGRRNTKYSKNCSSSGDETQNTAKTVCRRATKRKIQQKLLVVGRRNAKYSKNYSSSGDETQNHPKTAFPPRRKVKITRKLRFRHGGKSKSLENRVSATAENQNHPKTAKYARLSSRQTTLAARLVAPPQGQDKAEDRPSALSITAQCAN